MNIRTFEREPQKQKTAKLFVLGALVFALFAQTFTPYFISSQAKAAVVNEIDSEIPCGSNIVVNKSFEDVVVTASQQWDIFASGTPGMGWLAEWEDLNPATFSSLDRPDLANIELQSGVNGWTAKTGDQYTELDSDWDGPTGSVSGEPGSVTLYQDLATTPGATYEVIFHTSPRPGLDLTQNVTEFSWDNNIEDTIIEDGSANSNTVWTAHTYNLVASGSVTRIAFTDRGISDSLGGFLDQLSVERLDCDNNVSGMKFHDKDADGVKDGNEPGLPGWTICAVDSSLPFNNTSVFLDSSKPTGADTPIDLPAGQYLLSAMYAISPANNPLAFADVEYVTNDGWTTHTNGTTGYGEAGPNQGDVMVNGEFINWGPYQSNHKYVTLHDLPAGKSNFKFFDGDATNGTQINGWYNDNSGSFQIGVWFVLDCTITDANGNYTLTIPPGTLSTHIYEIPQAGWTQTYPVVPTTFHGIGDIPVGGGMHYVDKDFGNNQDGGTPEEPAANIYGYKVVCDTEADLPNWGDGASGPSTITSTTAADYVSASDGACHLEQGWQFQWGYADKGGQEGVDQLPSNWFGEGTEAGDSTGLCAAPYCGPNTDTGSDYNDWKTFDVPTTSNGATPAKAAVSELDGSDRIWVREVKKEGYIPFSVPSAPYPGSDVSAEIYCHNDILNYDNLEYIENPELGQDYYCVAFNTSVDDGGEDPQDPEDPIVYLHFFKQVCSAYSDIVGNQDMHVADDTNGNYQYFAAGNIVEPISPNEFSNNLGCDPVEDWQFKLSTDHAQANDVQITDGTDVNGGVTLTYADLNSELQDALTTGGQVWVSEVIPQDTATTFGALRCYVDALNGDNLEFITVDSNNIPEHIYCIAYNVEEQPQQPELKHVTGQKFNDENGDGDKDDGEEGLEDWTIYLAQEVGNFDVDSNGVESSQTGFVTDDDYLIRVSGTYDANDFIISDAMYSSRNFNPTWTDLVQTYEYYGTELLDLQIKSGFAGTYQSVNWGTFNPNHVYWFNFTSSGNDLYFKINDVAYNNTGSLDVTVYKIIASSVTDSNGDYDLAIPDGTVGSVIVAEQTADGWYQTMPMSDGYYSVDASTGGSEKDFGNHIACNNEEVCVNGISGMKFNDDDGNMLNDNSNTPIEGVTIYLDLNHNDQLDNGEPYDVTDVNGNYSFTNLPTGTYYVREIVSNGWVQTSPHPVNLSGEHEVLVLETMMTGYDFGNRRQENGGGGPTEGFEVSGFVYHDADFNQTKSGGDSDLSGWVVFLDTDDDGSLDGGETSTTTASDGSYSFSNLANGNYNVRQVTQAGWDQVEPADPFVHVVNMAGADVGDINFGNIPSSSGGGGGGSGGGGGGASGPGPVPLDEPTGQVLGTDTTQTPTLPMLMPQVLGEQLPRTGSSVLFFGLILLAVLTMRVKIQEALQA